MPEAFEYAAAIHPNWMACSDAAKKLHARNIHQVLGRDMATPVLFVVCWTPFGDAVGGTRTAIYCAHDHEIPIFNMYDPTALKQVGEYMRSLGIDTSREQ
jgi:hypothetical protein